MKRIILSVLFATIVCIGASAQQSDKKAIAEALKKELVAKLAFTEEKASKAAAIEEAFYKALTASAAMPSATTSERTAKDKKEHEAHVTRRENLMALPLSGRDMEDVVIISDRLHRADKKTS